MSFANRTRGAGQGKLEAVELKPRDRVATPETETLAETLHVILPRRHLIVDTFEKELRKN